MTRLTLSVTSHHCQIFLLFQMKAVSSLSAFTQVQFMTVPVSHMWCHRVQLVGILVTFTCVLLRGRCKFPDGRRGWEVALSASFHISTAHYVEIQRALSSWEKNVEEELGLQDKKFQKEIEDPTASLSLSFWKNKQMSDWSHGSQQVHSWRGEVRFGRVGPLFIRPRKAVVQLSKPFPDRRLAPECYCWSCSYCCF